MDQEIFEMERELYYLKQERTSLLLQIPDRTPLQKMLLYIIWFLAYAAAHFLNNWALPLLEKEITFEKFYCAFVIIILIDIIRAGRRAYIRKRAKEYSGKIKQLEREMGRRKIPD